MRTSRVVLIYGLIAVSALLLVMAAASSDSLGGLLWVVPFAVAGVLVLQGARLEPRLGLPLAAIGTLAIVTLAAIISGDRVVDALVQGAFFGALAGVGALAFRRMAQSQKG